MSTLKLVNKYLVFLSFLVVFLIGSQSSAFAATKGSTDVQARVGEYYLDLSGFASPYASIVLTTNGQFLRSATADEKGNFFISQVSIPEGFSDFCLESVDFKRVGDSSACFTIPPAKGSVTKKDIFLPPTIGVSGKKLLPNSSIFAFGYTMPGAEVSLHIGDEILTGTADSEGYYKIEITDLAPGSYRIFATASLNGQESEKPTNTILIQSLSATGAVTQNIADKLRNLIQFFTSIFELLMKYIWIVFPVLILIIILISKKLRDRVKGLRAVGARKRKETKLMHHYWMLGY